MLETINHPGTVNESSNVYVVLHTQPCLSDDDVDSSAMENGALHFCCMYACSQCK